MNVSLQNALLEPAPSASAMDYQITQVAVIRDIVYDDYLAASSQEY